MRDAAPGVARRDALATRPSGSSASAAAISLHGWPSTARCAVPSRRRSRGDGEREALVRIHGPDEAQRRAPLGHGRRLRFGGCGPAAGSGARREVESLRGFWCLRRGKLGGRFGHGFGNNGGRLVRAPRSARASLAVLSRGAALAARRPRQRPGLRLSRRHSASVATSTVVRAAAEPGQREGADRAVAGRLAGGDRVVLQALRRRASRASCRHRARRSHRAAHLRQRTPRPLRCPARTDARRARRAAAPAASGRTRSPECRVRRRAARRASSCR